MISLGERLHLLRKQHGWTLRDVALRSGISVSHQSDVERDSARASVDMLERLADAYGLTLADLLMNVRINGPVKLDYSI